MVYSIHRICSMSVTEGSEIMSLDLVLSSEQQNGSLQYFIWLSISQQDLG